MRRAATPRSSGIALVLIALTGCADRPPPLPTITGITPATGGVDRFIDVQIDGSGFEVRVFTDFDDPNQSTYDDAYQARVGSISLTSVRRLSGTALTGTVPAGVPEGLNDVSVIDPWGRTATLAGAYFGLPAGGLPTNLRLTAPGNVPLLTCQAVTVEQLNAGGSPTVALTPTVVSLAASPVAAFGIYGDGGCAGAITSATISPGQTSAIVYVRATARRTASLLATASGLASANHPFVFGPTQLVFTGNPGSIPVNVCSPSPGLQFELRDPAGAPSAVAAGTAVTLVASPATGLAFYDTAGCGGSPVTQVTVPAGSSSGAFFFKGTATGSYTVTATPAGLTGGSQGVTIVVSTASIFAFTPIAPQAVQTPFLITVEAQDGFGNLVTSFIGTATLAGQGGITLSCVSNCASSTTTTAFLLGRWSGWVVATTPAAGASIRATSGGTIVGNSVPFDVLAPGTAFGVPTARLAVRPGAVNGTGDTVALDARLSSDYDGGTAALQYSFDALGVTTNPPGTLPWTPWGSTATSTGTGYSTGVHHPRVAVRESANPSVVSYATATVVSTSLEVCVVNTDSLVDDGATTCSPPPPSRWGADGVLSLTEAIRLTSGTAGQAITTSTARRFAFSPGAPAVTISGATALSFATGTQLIDAPFSFNAAGVLVANAEIAGGRTWSVRGGDLLVSDGVVHDFAGFSATAPLGLTRVQMFNCSPTSPCVNVVGPQGALAVRSSEIRDAPGGAIRAVPDGGTCPAPVVDVETSTFLRSGVGIHSDCASGTRVVHATFHGNAAGVEYAGGSANNTLESTIFTSNTTATSCGGATFTSRDYNLLFQNGANGCAAGDPSTLSSDPLYFLPAAGDLRLRVSSPARDSAKDAGLDVNDVAPGDFFGAGPDRGGRETP